MAVDIKARMACGPTRRKGPFLIKLHGIHGGRTVGVVGMRTTAK